MDYLHNGDPYVAQKRRIVEDQQQKQPPPLTPPPPLTTVSTPTKPQGLKVRVREFEISRFATGQKKASRFGSDRFEMKVFFRDISNVAFAGPLRKDGVKFKLAATSGSYRLSGELVDSPEKTVGLFALTDTAKKETIEISYRAYKAKMTIRRDADQQLKPGSSLERQLKSFCDEKVDLVNHCTNSFGWINNWTVVDPSCNCGPSFYLVDVLRVVKSGQPAPQQGDTVFAFKGESKRTYRVIGNEDTGEAYETVDIPAESLTPDTASDVRMWANSETGGRRGFEMTLQDKETREKNDLSMEFEAEQPDDGPELTKEDTPVEYGPAANEDTGGEDEDVGPEDVADNSAPNKPSPGKTPAPAPKPQPQPPVAHPQPGVGAAFLATDMSRSRPARMIRDFNRNRGIPGVQRYISRFQKGDRKLPSIRDFFIYGNPFRSMLKAIANAYDVTPAYAYLAVTESAYVRSAAYPIEIGDGGLAVGPFQIHPDAAQTMGMPRHHRSYFAPSACGAAKQISLHVDRFKGDNTVAILAYNQGGGGAGKFVDRYKRLAGKFSYTYGDMERMGGVIDKQKEYVNKYLAIYFISSDLKRYGFDPRLPGARTRMPTNGTVMPRDGIKDSTCRAALNSVRI